MSHRAPWRSVRSQRSSAAAAFQARNRARTTSISRSVSLCILQAGLSWARRGAGAGRATGARSSISKIAKLRACNSCCAAPQAGRAEEPEEGRGPLWRMRRSSSAFAQSMAVRALSCTVKSDKDACTILQERFRHVGPYTAEFYLHSVGRSAITVPERRPPNKRMQPTHQPVIKIACANVPPCLAARLMRGV